MHKFTTRDKDRWTKKDEKMEEEVKHEKSKGNRSWSTRQNGK